MLKADCANREVKHEVEVDIIAKIAILRQLKNFFSTNKYKGSESLDFDSYNRVLDASVALIYDEEARVHKLCVNRKCLSRQESIHMIGNMITSLQKSTNRTANALKDTGNGGNTTVPASAQRDVIVCTGLITAHNLRLGGQDTVYHVNGVLQSSSGERAQQQQAIQQAQAAELAKISAALEEMKKQGREREEREKQDALAREQRERIEREAREKKEKLEAAVQAHNEANRKHQEEANRRASGLQQPSYNNPPLRYTGASRLNGLSTCAHLGRR